MSGTAWGSSIVSIIDELSAVSSVFLSELALGMSLYLGAHVAQVLAELKCHFLNCGSIMRFLPRSHLPGSCFALEVRVKVVDRSIRGSVHW